MYFGLCVLLFSEDLPFRSIRYIPAFATEPTYIDLLVRQIKESLSQLSTCGCFESQIGIVLTVHGGPEKANGLLTGVIDGQALFDRVQAQLQHEYPLISIGWINHDMPFIKWSQPNLDRAANAVLSKTTPMAQIKLNVPASLSKRVANFATLSFLTTDF